MGLEEVRNKLSNPNNQKEFKINDYVTLKIIDKEVYVFVGGQEFRQCKGYITIPDQKKGKVSIEDELWFYSSAIQAWFEYNFSEDILSLEFGFSLLYKLSELGMTRAKEALIPKIFERYSTGDDKGRLFLIKEGYIGYLLDNQYKVGDLRSLIKDKTVIQEFDKFFSYYSRCS